MPPISLRARERPCDLDRVAQLVMRSDVEIFEKAASSAAKSKLLLPLAHLDRERWCGRRRSGPCALALELLTLHLGGVGCVVTWQVVAWTHARTAFMSSALRAALRPLRPMRFWSTAMDAHDDWNMVVIGALNVAHAGWWFGLVTGGGALSFLFWADCAYLLLDSCWLVFVPSCVAARSRGTLLMHHALVCCLIPLAAGRPVLMRHLLRTWMVELHSFNHIATRWLHARLAAWAERLNKPLFVALRLIGYPLSWVPYARDRAALPALVKAAHVPLALHLPLSCAHFVMYGLMLKWGHALLRPPLKGTSKPSDETSQP